jgi:hypothetical protein
MKQKILVTSKDAKIPIFDSSLLSFQVKISGVLNCHYPGSPEGDSYTYEKIIPHNLGYKPICYVYFKDPNGRIVKSQFYFYSYTWCHHDIGENSITAKVTSTSQDYPTPEVEEFDYDIYYYIFKQPIFLDRYLGNKTIEYDK